MTAMAEAVMVRPEEAERERARREKARRHLVDFSEYVSPWYQAARHQRLTAERLERVEEFIRTKGRSGIGRLMIFEPPRYGKSEQVSRHFPAWLLGKNPEARVALTSYGAELAEGNSKAVRDIVEGARFSAVFGALSTVETVELSTDSRAVNGWDLAAPHRGGMAAAGVGGPLTGKGAHLLIVDDPFKNREEAESRTTRDKVWDWWTSTAYTRLEEGGAIVLVQTRWNGDDLAGRLLKRMVEEPRADQWTVLMLMDRWDPPTTPEGKTWEEFFGMRMKEGVYEELHDPLGRKPGEALWPEKYSAEDLARIETNIGPYDYAALYRQMPNRRTGNFFRREWFVIVEEGPKAETVVKRIRAWDKAGTAKGMGGDFLAGVLLSHTQGGKTYVEHMVREQCTPGEREEIILRTARSDRARPGPVVVIWHQQDPGTAGLESAQNTNNRLAKEGFEAHFETLTGDKEVRAGPWATALEGGSVFVVRGGWNEAFVEEHAAFPKGRYDDQVDVSSWGWYKLVGNLLDGKLFY